MQAATAIRQFICLAGLVLLLSPLALSQTHRESSPSVRRWLNRNSLTFTENRGQLLNTEGKLCPEILYSAESDGVSAYFTRTGVRYVFSRIDGDLEAYFDHDCTLPSSTAGSAGGHHAHERDGGADGLTVRLHRMDMDLVGANPNATVTAGEMIETRLNYYLAHSPSGITGVRSFRELRYHDIYPNIDMIVRGGERGVKCDFVVHPGGRVADIRIRYTGGNELALTRDGALHAATPLGYIQEDAPYSYQDGYGGRRTVESRYTLAGDLVTFSVGSYDPTRPLVIDPAQLWATFFGGNMLDNLDGGDPSEVDRNGNVLMAGFTLGAFPVVAQPGGYQQAYRGTNGVGSGGDAFVVKFNPDGNLLWATYYGGSGGEIAHGVATDAAGNVFIVGHTESIDMPVAAAFQPANAYDPTVTGSDRRDAFIVKFDPNGARLWGTYYGGLKWDDGYGFAVDSTGNVAVLLTSESNGLQTAGKTPRSMAHDAHLAKFSAAGGRLWGTYYGGRGIDYGYAAASDAADNIIITGWTRDSVPTLNAAQPNFGGGVTDAFAAKFNSGGTLQWSTYAGGAGDENEGAVTGAGGTGYCGIATDGSGAVFITGVTTGGTPGFPTTAGAFQQNFQGGGRDAFIVKYNANGVRQWSTYVGGSGSDVGVGAAANTLGGVMITGFTTSGNLPTARPGTQAAFQPGLAGGEDAFIVKLGQGGAAEWVTYFGGGLSDRGEGISFDSHGSIIIAGHTSSNGAPFAKAGPQQGAPVQPNNNLNTDAFISVFCDIVRPRIDSIGSATFCYGDSARLRISGDYITKRWYRAAATPVQVGAGDTLVAKESGRYYAKVENAGGCAAYSDTVIVTQLAKLNPALTGPASFCQGDTIELGVSSPPVVSYTWRRNGVTIPAATGATIRVAQGGTYRVIVRDAKGCRDSSEMTVAEHPRPDSIWVEPADTLRICQGSTGELRARGGSGGSIVWSDGRSGSTLAVSAPGLYYATSVTPNGCERVSRTVAVVINPVPLPEIEGARQVAFCAGDSTLLTARPNPAVVKYIWSTGDTARSTMVRAGGDVVLKVIDINGCEGRDTVRVTVNPPPRPEILGPARVGFCSGESIRIDARTNPGFVKYIWSTGDTAQSTTVRRSGDVVLKVIDTNGCSGFDTVAVQMYENPQPEILTLRPLAFCEGDSSVLAVAQHTRYRSYRWSTGETTRSITVRRGGEITLQVIDTNGCSGEARVMLVMRPLPDPKIVLSGPATFCEGDSVRLSVEGSYAAYRWSDGSNTPSIMVGKSSTYSVRVTNADGCERTSGEISVTMRPLPDATIAGPKAVCANSDATYSVPMLPGAIYDWNVEGAGGAILSGAGSNAIVVSWGPAGKGRVSVAVRNDLGCMAESALDVETGSALKPNITTDRPARICTGEEITLDAGPGFGSYLWSTGATTRTVTVAAPGLYSVTVADARGCSGSSDPFLVEQSSEPAPVITMSGDGMLCPGDTVELDAGPGYREYRWSGGETIRKIRVWKSGEYFVAVSDTNGCRGLSKPVRVTVAEPPKPLIDGPNSVCIASAGRYSVKEGVGDRYTWSVRGGTLLSGQGTSAITVRWPDAGAGTIELAQLSSTTGCQGVATYDVTIGTTLEPKITSNRSTAICDGDSITLSAPAGYASYLWTTGARTQSITVREPGTYGVTVAEAGGCSGSGTIAVSLKPAVVPSITPNRSTVLCGGDSVVLAAPAGYSAYLWSTGSTAESITVHRGGTYAVTVIDLDGCSGAASITVTERGGDLRLAILSDRSTSLCDGDTVTLTASAGFASYRWSTGDTTRSITVREPRLYAVVAADSGGCIAAADVAVTQKEKVEPRIVPDGRPGVCPGDSILLEATAGYNSYLWSTGETTRAIWVKKAGNYTVTVVDADGCSGVASEVEVVVYPVLPRPRVMLIGDTLLAIIDTADAPRPTGFQWYLDGKKIAGAVERTLKATAAGSYSVEVVDAFGCTATSLAVTPSPSGFAESTVEVPVISAAPGERVRIPIRLVGSRNLDRHNMKNFTARLRFNRHLLVPADDRYPSVVEGEDRVVTIAGERVANAEAGDLVTLEFVAALADTISTPLLLEVFDWIDPANVPVPATRLHGYFQLRDLCETGGRRLVDASGNVGLKSARPNPASGVTAIEYEIVEEGRTELFLVDLLGNRVLTLADEPMKPGAYLAQFDASRLPQGTYFCILQTPTMRFNRRMQVVR